MSQGKTKEQKLIEAITSRFLKSGSTFKNLSEILDAPITALKNISDKNARLLEEAGFITRISDLVELDPQEPFHSLLQGKGEIDDPIKFSMLKKNIIDRLVDRISPDLMKDMIIAARLISRAEKKQDFYIKEKKEQKILFLGLDNAGKTAIINIISGKINLSVLQKLKPTKRVARDKIVTKDLEIFIWDLGGQKEYRETYLKKENLEMFFLQTDMIVYVIDMQDPERFSQSFEYLREILHTLDYLDEDPFILFFLHKSDPDLIDDPEFQINLETIKDELLKLIEPFKFEYDAYPTSIYYLYSREAKFSSFIKGVLKDQKEADEVKKDPIKAMGEVLDTAMNLTVNLANAFQEELGKINQKFYMLEQRIYRMEQSLLDKIPGTKGAIPSQAPPSIVSPPQGPPSLHAGPPSMPPGISPPSPMGRAGGIDAVPQSMLSSKTRKTENQNIRTTMMDELKAIFAKKRIQ
ncbi:MAG: ADP-ribosylation factor-like protein [Promethearchaeota archaeon]